MDQPGAKMGRKALSMMADMFRRQDIKTAFGKKITEFEADGVVFEDGSKLQSDLTMFIAAGTGSPVLKKSDLPAFTESGICKNKRPYTGG
jgi:sulfide:quinone oxidoreductase